MQELIKVNYNDKTVLARDVYEYIYRGQEKKQVFTHWFNRTVKKYGFVEAKDFMPVWTESTGGRPSVDYVVSFDMGKELAMVAPTEQGKKTREYFLKCEDIVINKIATEKAIRLLGKATRKTLTDAIEESGENERMHGRGYSNFTRLVYSLTNLMTPFNAYKYACKIDGVKPDKFRETMLTPEELKRVELAESLIKPMLEMEREYSEIKVVLEPLFKTKEIK
jgi:phage anti-repressor protein